ncbi:RDD family protein [gamma proteobacterium HdN1]|nr:RDD family protein [gamma proteobacterium HdN1]
MLDTRYQVETPENIVIEMRVAGPLVRAIAWLIDLTLRGIVIAGIGYALTLFSEIGFGILSILIFLAEWFYPVAFEVLNHGQTPGKKSLGLQVLNDDGTPVSWSTSILRNLLRFVDFLPMMYGTGLITCCISKQFRRLGDLAAGTVVIYSPPPLLKPVPAPLSPLPLPLSLNVEEQRSVLAFSERTAQLSAHRQQELAELFMSALSAKHEDTPSGDDPAKQLRRYAVWLMGAK